MTEKEWLLEWLEVYVKPNLAPNTYRCYNDTVKRILREVPEFLLKNGDEITELEIQKFVNLLGFKYARSTLNDIRVVMNQSFIAAVSNNLCTRNPINHISIPKYASEKYVRPLTQAEQKMVEEAAKEDPLGHIVIFFLYSGLRSSELCNLKWSDYDPQKGIIRVRKSKTKAGIRIVPLIPETQAIIDGLQEKIPQIFTSTRGGPVTESVLKKLYLRMRKKTGLDFITNHVYRHSFATRMIEEGADYKALSKILGHTDVAFTLRRYTDAEDRFLTQQIYLLHNKNKEKNVS